MSGTRRLGVLDVDATQILDDLRAAETLPFVSPYSEFSTGERPWRSILLWSPGGDIGSGLISEYDLDEPGAPTPHAGVTGYLVDLIDQNFDTDRLLFVRLGVMSNDVLIPHRDYLEMPSGEREPCFRIHVPLATTKSSRFLENDTCFWMDVGECWLLDVTQLHSAAVLGPEPRAHLILDFCNAGDVGDLIRLDAVGVGIPDERHYPRPELDLADGSDLGLGIDLATASPADLIGATTRLAFEVRCSAGRAWDLAVELADRSPNPEMGWRTRELRHYCAQERLQ